VRDDSIFTAGHRSEIWREWTNSVGRCDLRSRRERLAVLPLQYWRLGAAKSVPKCGEADVFTQDEASLPIRVWLGPWRRGSLEWGSRAWLVPSWLCGRVVLLVLHELMGRVKSGIKCRIDVRQNAPPF